MKPSDKEFGVVRIDHDALEVLKERARAERTTPPRLLRKLLGLPARRSKPMGPTRSSP